MARLDPRVDHLTRLRAEGTDLSARCLDFACKSAMQISLQIACKSHICRLLCTQLNFAVLQEGTTNISPAEKYPFGVGPALIHFARLQNNKNSLEKPGVDMFKG